MISRDTTFRIVPSRDDDVGRIAGAIYMDVSRWFDYPPFVLVPALTFKIRKLLETIESVENLAPEGKDRLADQIRISIVPLLFALDIELETIEEMAPVIQEATRQAMDRTW